MEKHSVSLTLYTFMLSFKRISIDNLEIKNKRQEPYAVSTITIFLPKVVALYAEFFWP